jgi:excinuclease ABC subunit A
LDEPTIGLHPRDNSRLIEAIKTLQKKGNSVLVVEHDEAVIREADHVIEIGPVSGRFGGELVEHHSSLQGSVPKAGEAGRVHTPSVKWNCVVPASFIVLKNACTHNLKNVTVSFPLQRLICVTGVSGSGKSSLINETLVPLVRDFLQKRSVPNLIGAENIDKLIEIDQTPLGRSSRSNPATYSGMFDELRKLFALTKDAKRRGYKANRFSFNAGGGRCETCQGQGTQKIETPFLNDYYAVCPVCNGKRFNRQTQMVKYKGKSIADVLEMPVEEAKTFFENIPAIDRILQRMVQIGLGYLSLGQPSSALSGGEAQRVKLTTELAKTETGKTLYVLDEPTTGLHRSDVFRLLDVLSDLSAKGNTVIVIEHNLDVADRADWLIELGPEGGSRGGYVIKAGGKEE